jgi:tetratricopeptide (TPR) repeat protein
MEAPFLNHFSRSPSARIFYPIFLFIKPAEIEYNSPSMTDNAGESARSHDMPAEERRIREFLSQARWRKARDEAKPLVKLDRSRYLPLLVEANVGLAREMLAKGLNSEARQVVAYLKTIAPKEVGHSLETEIAVAYNDFSGIAAHSTRLLTEAGPAISESEQCRLADQLVVAFDKPSGDGLGNLPAELEAIHSALNHVSAEWFDLAADALRPIGAHSIFRHWKLFIKGLISFHQGDRGRALRLLTGLPDDSVVTRAAAPYLFWLDPKGKRLKDESEPMLQLLARFSGSAQSASTIMRAERLWWEGNPQEMYSLLRKSIEEFPSERLDWTGALSQFSLNCLSILPLDTAEPFVTYLDNLDRHTKSATEKKMLNRTLSLHFAKSDSLLLLEQWDQYLRLRDRLDGPNERLSSIAYEWLGTVLLGLDQKTMWDSGLRLGPLRETSNVKAALDALEKSAQLDSGNFQGQLLLVYLYDRLKRHGNRNRLLDQMTGRFPENKRVLFLAGNRCIERKAYVKGLSYLTKALEQDRLDPAIPETIVIARTLYALEQYRRGRTNEARKILEAADSFVVERQDDFIRSRWSMLLRRSILEQFYGDPESAEKLWTSSRTASPGEEALLFLGHILSRLYRRTSVGVDSFAKKFRAGLASATVSRAVLLLRIFDFWINRNGAPPLNEAQSLMREYLRSAAKRPFSRAEACELIERITPISPFQAERKPFIMSVLKKDSKDPLFRFFDYCDENWGFLGIEGRRRKLNEIMQEAMHRKDDAAIQAIRRELQALDSSIPEPFPNVPDFWDDDDDDGDDDFDDDDDDFDDDDDDFAMEEIADEMMRSLSSSERATFMEIAKMLSNASEQELRKIQKTKPKGVPQIVFDLFLEAIRARAQQDSDPDVRPRSRRPKGSSQRNLF